MNLLLAVNELNPHVACELLKLITDILQNKNINDFDITLTNNVELEFLSR